LGEEEGGKTWFSNKRDRIIQHFKKCSNFVSKTTAEERAEIFKLLENNKELALSSGVSTSTLSNKRPCNY
jgi:hypothetical protein